MNTHYYRRGRVIFERVAPGDVRPIARARSRFAAALTVRALIATEGGIKGDWRKYLDYEA